MSDSFLILEGQRDSLGRLRKAHCHPSVWDLRRAMLDAITPEVITRLTTKMIELCEHEDPKVALSALDMLHNRVFGKPREHVELDVTAKPAPTFTNLDATDLAALERMRAKLLPEPEAEDAIIDAEATVKALSESIEYSHNSCTE